MPNPIEELFSELLSVKGILQTIVIVVLIFVLFSITGSLKQVDSSNQLVNDTLTNVEQEASSGISWFLLLSGIIGAITLIILGVKAVLWLLEEFGITNDLPFHY
jgi:putative exporter of polyketide antibiotics